MGHSRRPPLNFVVPSSASFVPDPFLADPQIRFLSVGLFLTNTPFRLGLVFKTVKSQLTILQARDSLPLLPIPPQLYFFLVLFLSRDGTAPFRIDTLITAAGSLRRPFPENTKHVFFSFSSIDPTSRNDGDFRFGC